MMPRLLLLLVFSIVSPAFAQVPDTVSVSTDPAASDTTVAAPSDTLDVPPPSPPVAPDSVVAFFRDERGEAVRRGDPARSPALHVSEWLMDVPGAFLHTFRTPGWPDGWSPLGFAPGTVTVQRDGYAHVNLMTGRAAMEMIPFGVMDPPRLAAGVDGSPAGIVLNTQTLDQPRPITGLRYQTDNIGLQHVEATHAQRRLVSIFGRTGELNLTGAYMGRGAGGEYPGSMLRRERALLGRVRFARPEWSLQVTNLYGRHRVGAHGGVVPWTGGVYETIYSRTDAVVRSSGARRFTIRNDLDARLRLERGGSMSDVAAYRTSESFRYLLGDESVATRIHRSGMNGSHARSFGIHHLRVTAEGWIEHVENDSAMTTRRDHRRFAAELGVGDSLSVAGFNVIVDAGLRHVDAGTSPVARARLTRMGWIGSAYLDLGLSTIDIPRIAIQGFGGHAAPLASARPGQAITARTGLAITPGGFRFEMGAYVVSERHRLMLWADEDNVLQFIQSTDPAERAGVTLRSAYRAEADRGIYADVRGTLIRWITDPVVPGIAPLAESQPAVWGSARLGARMLLFQGDLDADLYVRGHAWSGMRGRALHPITGLLALPSVTDRRFDPSGILDVMLEAQVRTATIIVGFENVLSGSTVTPGNLIVPDYPLPERRFRIGVFWPILD